MAAERPASGRNAGAGRPSPAPGDRPGWTFLTNHAHVLVCIATADDATGRDIAAQVGITERAVQAIVADLVSGGYVVRTKEGRRNRYSLNPDLPLRHPIERDHTVGELLAALGRLGDR